MRSYGLVDEKLEEADFFLEKLANSDFGETRFYFSAFVSSARSITFALQAAMGDIEGFEEWYNNRQAELKADPIAKFFHKARTESQHIGINPVNQGFYYIGLDGKPVKEFYFSYGLRESLKNVPKMDVISSCRFYLTTLVRIIYDCYQDFGAIIDPHQYYTLENIHRLGLSVEDVEESLGFPRGWTKIRNGSDEERMQVLRASVPGSQIGWLFEKYLNLPLS